MTHHSPDGAVCSHCGLLHPLTELREHLEMLGHLPLVCEGCGDAFNAVKVVEGWVTLPWGVPANLMVAMLIFYGSRPEEDPR